MAPKRSLPAAKNPLLQPEHTPQHEVLVSRRRLGQTDFSVKPGQKGASNAAKDEALGIFDYAHLRCPLPKDLKGSGIFVPSKSNPVLESYFLMRRSADGYVSATGMFKAAFPWASITEESKERAFIKTLATADPQEAAGNIWLPPVHALDLANDYSVRPWIEALLDSEDILSPDENKSIASPPPFKMPPKTPRGSTKGTASVRKRTASKDKSSTSPAQKDLPPPSSGTPRPKASPRKRATKKDDKEQAPVEKTPKDKTPKDNTPKDKTPKAKTPKDKTPKAKATKSAPSSPKADAKSASKALQSAIGASKAEVIPGGAPPDKVRVSVHSAVERDGDVETTHTAVKVDVPANAPDLPVPKDAKGLVEMGKEIVAEAAKLEAAQKVNGTAPKTVGRKRKADKIAEDEASATTAMASLGTGAGPLAKRPKLEDELYREKIRSRALIGLSATLAIGAAIPYLSNFF